jgi:hypothetical protein
MNYILKRFVCFLFLGKAYQHLFGDAPYRAFFWDENLMGRVTSLIGISWNTYTMYANLFANGLQRFIGFIFLIISVIVFFETKMPRLTRFLNIFGAFWLCLLAFLHQKDQFYQIGQFLEYALQITTPLIFIQWIQKKEVDTFIYIAIALTFSCHGLYAIGYYAIPAGFIEMTLNVLNCNETQAKVFLKIMGLLDFLASIFLFFPKFRQIGLVYCILWGFLTMMARPFAYLHTDLGISNVLYWFAEALCRMPHFGIPFLLYQKIKLEKIKTIANEIT